MFTTTFGLNKKHVLTHKIALKIIPFRSFPLWFSVVTGFVFISHSMGLLKIHLAFYKGGWSLQHIDTCKHTEAMTQRGNPHKELLSTFYPLKIAHPWFLKFLSMCLVQLHFQFRHTKQWKRMCWIFITKFSLTKENYKLLMRSWPCSTYLRIQYCVRYAHYCTVHVLNFQGQENPITSSDWPH